MSRVAVIEGNEIKYHVMDPTGNITILVETPVEEASQPFVASKLMEAEPEAEQVGFLTSPVNETWDIALRMAGGEFCGNATMSAAAFYAAGAGIEKGIVTVCVSGAAQPVPVDLLRLFQLGPEIGGVQLAGQEAVPKVHPGILINLSSEKL